LLVHKQKIAQAFFEDKLYMSEPVPESVSILIIILYPLSSLMLLHWVIQNCVPVQNDEDVQTVVGKTIDQIVFDESKDVLLVVWSWQIDI
jgi:hypothetical protein